jgi:hypothetical protein
MLLDIRQGTVIPTKSTESTEYVDHLHYYARMLTSQTNDLFAYTHSNFPKATEAHFQI